VSINCIRTSWNGITITTNLEDLSTTDFSPRLPQSKSYLKILSVPFFGNNSLNPVNNSQVEEILSKTEMFHGITLAACPRVIRASRNSDMAVIWIDIWDSQNGTKAKTVIN